MTDIIEVIKHNAEVKYYVSLPDSDPQIRRLHLVRDMLFNEGFTLTGHSQTDYRGWPLYQSFKHGKRIGYSLIETNPEHAWVCLLHEQGHSIARAASPNMAKLRDNIGLYAVLGLMTNPMKVIYMHWEVIAWQFAQRTADKLSLPTDTMKKWTEYYIDINLEGLELSKELL